MSQGHSNFSAQAKELAKLLQDQNEWREFSHEAFWKEGEQPWLKRPITDLVMREPTK